MAGRFKKIQRIGRGTFGEAWLVSSTCSGRRYVIKEVRVEEMSAEELEKTRTEATILARCKHSSIIRYKEYFMLADPAVMCLVMEYADGGDLSVRVKEARKKGTHIAEETILHWFVQVIFAVQYLHRNNILHRDLKTQNIFLTKTNLVKVGDFGIARFLRDKQDLATTAIGTPYYLSPEICQRRPYNHKSDMWAVGCILYELCALKHPFDADTFEDLIIKILRGVVLPLPSAYTSLVQDLATVMLRTNPERRPTADALLMLPALKPYVENYLLKHEELLSSRTSTAYTSQAQNKIIASLSRERQPRPSLDLKSGVGSRRDSDLREGVLKAEVHPRPVGGAGGPEGMGMRERCVSDSAIRREPSVSTPVTVKGNTAPRIHEGHQGSPYHLQQHDRGQQHEGSNRTTATTTTSTSTTPPKKVPLVDDNQNVLPEEPSKGDVPDFSETYVISKCIGHDFDCDSVFEL